MKKFLKVIFLLIVWAVVAAGIYVAVLATDSPMEYGVYVFLALIGLWLLFLILRKLIVRRRAKKRVKALISEEAAEPAEKKKRSFFGGLFRKPPETSDLPGRFKSLLHLVKKSRLKKQGDPLYVLPWFILVGSDRSEETEALDHAGLPAPIFDDDPPVRGELNWRPYNQAILLETPARYIEASDRHGAAEWRRLGELLMEHREKEPVSGIVIAKSVDELSETGENDLLEEGRTLRARIDELMRSLKIRIPVYLMITKCDRIVGFTEFCRRLPAESRARAMGCARKEDDEPAGLFIPKALSVIEERIKDFLLLQPALNHELLRLSGGIQKLEGKLAAFTGGIFQENPYQDSPYFRGVYMNCVLPSGASGNGDSPESLRKEGCFLRDFFTDILPRDRIMISTLTGLERAGWVAKTLIAGVWGIAGIAAILGLWLLYDGDVGFLEDKQKKFQGVTIRQKDVAGNIESLSVFREQAVEFEERVDDWWMPWLGIGEKKKYISKINGSYSERYRKDLLGELRRRLDREIQKRPATKPAETALRIEALVRRINVLNSWLKKPGRSDLSSLPAPFPEGAFYLGDEIGPEKTEALNRLYIQSLPWLETTEVESERDELERHLVSLLHGGGSVFSWVIPLANESVRPDILLSSFWIGSGALRPEIRVESAFTVAGKEFVDDFVERIFSAGPDSPHLGKMEEDFRKLYEKEYLKAWKDFALNFDKGIATLRGREEWGAMIDMVGSRKNPYFRALETAREQLAPFSSYKEAPEWLKLLEYYRQMATFSPEDSASESKKKGVLARVGLNVLNKLGAVGKAVSDTGRETMATRRQLAAAGAADDRANALNDAGKALGEYRQALMDAAFNVDARAVSFKAMEDFFSNPNNPGAGDGPEARAFQSIRKLQALIGRENRSSRPFWSIYSGPLKLIRGYMLNEACCELQQRWNDKFLVEIEEVPEYKLPGLIYGPEGKIWKFLETEARPFVSRRFGKGYVPARVRGVSLPFNTEFLEFISRAGDNLQQREESRDVVIRATPTSANEDALLQPHATTLKIQCADEVLTLKNFNFDAEKTFSWGENCGDVSFSISIGDLVLEKIYAKPGAFAKFLNEFRFGKMRFTPEDFPEHARRLKDLKVAYIDAQYEISGHEPMIASLKEAPSRKVPRNIIYCWTDAPTRKAAPRPGESPCPDAPASLDEEQKTIMKTLLDWADAWSTPDVDRYIGYYAGDFKTPGGMSREDWEAQRRKRLIRRFIRLDLGGVEIEFEACDRARATFDQVYESDTFTDTSRKRLSFRKTDDGWRITAEETVDKM